MLGTRSRGQGCSDITRLVLLSNASVYPSTAELLQTLRVRIRNTSSQPSHFHRGRRRCHLWGGWTASLNMLDAIYSVLIHQH